MQTEIKLWDRPQLAKSFREYQGMSTIELIEKEPWIVLHHVKNHNWILSDTAKAEMATKKKIKA